MSRVNVLSVCQPHPIMKCHWLTDDWCYFGEIDQKSMCPVITGELEYYDQCPLYAPLGAPQSKEFISKRIRTQKHKRDKYQVRFQIA